MSSVIEPKEGEPLVRMYQQYRSRWAREDELINHRITWLGVSQAIMAAAYGLTFQFDLEKIKLIFDKNPEVPIKLSAFVNLIPLVGMAISFTIFLGVFAAMSAALIIHRKWRREWENATGERAFRNPQWSRMRIFVTVWTTALGFACALFMPLAFFVFWHAVRYQPAWILKL